MQDELQQAADKLLDIDPSLEPKPLPKVSNATRDLMPESQREATKEIEKTIESKESPEPTAKPEAKAETKDKQQAPENLDPVQQKLKSEGEQWAEASNAFMQQYGNVDWSAFRAQVDEETFNNEYNKYLERKNALDTQAIELQDAWQYNEAAKIKQHLDTQHEKLKELIPSWRDPEVKKLEANALRDYLKMSGYSEQEIQELSYGDARHIKVIHDAWKATQSPKPKKKAPRAKLTDNGRIARKARKMGVSPTSMEAAALVITEKGLV